MELSSQDEAFSRENDPISKSKVETWLGEFLDVAKINPKVLKRLELLNQITNFIEEERESIQYAKKLFDYYEREQPDRDFTKEEKEVVMVGLILADIGKTGPASANEMQQALIIRLFNIEGVKDIKRPIRHFIETRFTETKDQDLDLLREMSIDPSISIEKFWRLHSGWTLEDIEGQGIPEEDIPGAALHHILEGDNVHLIDEGGNFKDLVVNGEVKLRFGENRKFDKPEKLIVLFDKYAAFVKRLKGMTHEEAVKRLRDILSRNIRYKNDSQFLELINDLNIALSN